MRIQTLAGRMNKYDGININGCDILNEGRDPLPPSFIQISSNSWACEMNAKKTLASKIDIFSYESGFIFN